MYLWVIDHMTWAMSVMTIWSSWLAGGKSLLTQKVKLVGQVLWTIWVFGSQTWGLVPLNIAMWFLILRAYTMWKADDDRDLERGTTRVAVGSRERFSCLEIDAEGQQRVARYALLVSLSNYCLYRVQGSGQETTAAANDAPR